MYIYIYIYIYICACWQSYPGPAANYRILICVLDAWGAHIFITVFVALQHDPFVVHCFWRRFLLPPLVGSKFPCVALSWNFIENWSLFRLYHTSTVGSWFL